MDVPVGAFWFPWNQPDHLLFGWHRSECLDSSCSCNCCWGFLRHNDVRLISGFEFASWTRFHDATFLLHRASDNMLLNGLAWRSLYQLVIGGLARFDEGVRVISLFYRNKARRKLSIGKCADWLCRCLPIQRIPRSVFLQAASELDGGRLSRVAPGLQERRFFDGAALRSWRQPTNQKVAGSASRIADVWIGKGRVDIPGIIHTGLVMACLHRAGNGRSLGWLDRNC